MATEASPARASAPSSSSMNTYYPSSPPRKPLPVIPISSPNERIQRSPVSPVKINFQPEDLSHKASSAQIVDENTGSHMGQKAPRLSSPKILLPALGSTNLSGHDRTQSEASLATTDPEKNDAILKSPGGTFSPGLGREMNDGSPNGRSSPEIQPVPPLQYHHIRQTSDDEWRRGQKSQSPTEQVETGVAINRRLTPQTTLQRPTSSYSLMSDMGPRGRSPVAKPNSPSWGGRDLTGSGRSPDSRPTSMIDLLNVPYSQQAAPTMSFDNSQLRANVGSNASLLSTEKTLELYRQNVKKTSDMSIQYAFAIFLISAAQETGQNDNQDAGKSSPKGSQSPNPEGRSTTPAELIREARHILQRLADRSYPFAQYYLADGYASGLFSKGKEDYNTAFPLFVAASKHGHAESGYRAALCYEFGWGCRKDPAKAVQFYRQSASKNHPGAMTRLGSACLAGDLGLRGQYREGLKWLKRATESADPQYNTAPYQLGLLYETGYGADVFQDEAYAAQLFTQAADLGHPEAAYRMGDAYEYGKLCCPQDPALSIHFYTAAAQKGHPAAMMALCAWYIVGAPPVLEKDENEAYEWAHRAADAGLTKAQYAMGYFTEMGLGCRRDPLEANVWYVKAADAGDERAKVRLAAIQAAAAGSSPNAAGGKKGKKDGATDKDKECVVM